MSVLKIKLKEISEHTLPILRNWYFWIWLTVSLSVAYRLWNLGAVPEGYQIDEMGSAYDAWSLLNYGVDRYQISWPVYFINFGGGQSALYTYMMVGSMALFGFTQFAIRLPLVITSVLFVFSGLGIIGLIWNDAYGIRKEVPQLIFVLLYAVSPYMQMSARLGLDCNMMLGWSTAFMYTFLLAIDRTKKESEYCKIFWFLSGFAAGVTLYTYAISYLVMPLFLVAVLIYAIFTGQIQISTKSRNNLETAAGEANRHDIYKMRRPDRKGEFTDCTKEYNGITLLDILIFAIPLSLLAAPLLLEQYVNMTGHDAITLLGTFTVTRLTSYRVGEWTFSNIIDNLFLTIKAALFYDHIDYNTTYRFWTFYPMSVPFFFVGLMASMSRLMDSVSHRRYDPFAAPVLWFCVQLFICCLMGEHGETSVNPNTNKINGIFYGVMLFIVVGYVYCFRNIAKIKWKKVTACVLGAVYLVFFARFTGFYFTSFEPTSLWRDTYEELIDYIEEDDVLSEKGTFINMNDFYYICYLASALPSPYEIDVSAGDYGSYHMSTNDDIMAVLSDDTDTELYNFIIYNCPDELREMLAEEGFEEVVYGEYSLFVNSGTTD